MKLPSLKSAPVQRLALEDPSVAGAAGAAGRTALGSISKLMSDHAQTLAVADFDEKAAQIRSYSESLRQDLMSEKMLDVDTIDQDIDLSDMDVEDYYDEATDSFRKRVPGYQIRDDIYTSRMDAFVREIAGNARNEAVAERLQKEALANIITPTRGNLFTLSLKDRQSHALAKYQHTLAMLIQQGDEEGALGAIARNAANLGLHADTEAAALGAKIDQAYFDQGAKRARTSWEIEVLKDALALGEWRFDADAEKSTYAMLIKRESNLASAEKEQTKINQDSAYTDAIGVINTDGMTVDEVNEFKWLRPEQYKSLMTMATTDASAFKTPELTRLWAERSLQAISRSDYSGVGTDNFEDARVAFRDTLEKMVGQFDPFDGKNYDQKISAADYTNYSQQLIDMDQIGYDNKQVAIGKNQIYIMVAGASQAAFDFNPDKNADRQIALNDALGDYYRYIETAGPDAEPMEWVQKNLYKYTAGPAKAAVMGIDSTFSDMRDAGMVWTDGGTKLDYQTMLNDFKDQLKNAHASGNTTAIDSMLKALEQLGRYKENFPLNVRE